MCFALFGGSVKGAENSAFEAAFQYRRKYFSFTLLIFVASRFKFIIYKKVVGGRWFRLWNSRFGGIFMDQVGLRRFRFLRRFRAIISLVRARWRPLRDRGGSLYRIVGLRQVLRLYLQSLFQCQQR